MTYDNYKSKYSRKDHVLIRMTDSFPFFKEKYIVENGEEKIETNYHIANGVFSCYINYEMPKHPLAAEITGTITFELHDGYGCPVLITNVGNEPIEVNIGTGGSSGTLHPGEVFGIYPRGAAMATQKIFEDERRKRFGSALENGLTQAEINKLLNGGTDN